MSIFASSVSRAVIVIAIAGQVRRVRPRVAARLALGIASGLVASICPAGAFAHDGRHHGQTLVDHVMTSAIDFGAVAVLSIPLIALMRQGLSARGARFRRAAAPAMALAVILLGVVAFQVGRHVFAGAPQPQWYAMAALGFAGTLLLAFAISVRGPDR